MSSQKGFRTWYRSVSFANDIVLIDKAMDGVNQKLEWQRDTLEAIGFKLSRSKIEYLKCRFSGGEGSNEDEVSLGHVPIPKVEKFRYLGSIIQEEGDIDEDINQRIKIG